MSKIFISEESPEWEITWEEWKKQAKSVESIEEFNDFYNHLMNDYHHDYGTVCRAIGELAVAAASLGANEQGITGFQAGFVMWEFLGNWLYNHNKVGLGIIDFDNMLYPQYQYKFEKTITPRLWDALQKEAASRLDKDSGLAHPDVIKHWKSIIDGTVPFGYKVENE